MPEHLLNHLRVLAVDEAERRSRVTKIVEPHVRGIGVGGIPYTMKDMQIKKLVVVRSKEL